MLASQEVGVSDDTTVASTTAAATEEGEAIVQSRCGSDSAMLNSGTAAPPDAAALALPALSAAARAG